MEYGNSKDFAIANAGKTFKYPLGVGGWSNITARVVGWHGTYVAVEQPGGWSVDSTNGQATEWVVPDPQNGWWVSVNDISSYEFRDPLKPIQQPKPYPTKCSRCHQPARKLSNAITACSNERCPSRRKLNQRYHRKPTRPMLKSGTKTTKSGAIVYVDAWRDGGCAACGAPERDDCTWTHNECWNDLPNGGREIMEMLREDRL